MEQNMTVAEALKQSGSVTALQKNAIKAAQSIIAPGEEIRCAICGIAWKDPSGTASGVLVLTDRRLFFVSGITGFFKEMDIAALRSVEQMKEGSLGAMRVVAEADVLLVRDKRQCIAAMVRAIHKALGIEMPPEAPKPEKAARQPKSRKHRAPTPAEIRCPNCGSLRHRVYRYPKSNPYFIRNATILFLRLLLRLYTVFILEGKTLECCDCGCRWRP